MRAASFGRFGVGMTPVEAAGLAHGYGVEFCRSYFRDVPVYTGSALERQVVAHERYTVGTHLHVAFETNLAPAWTAAAKPSKVFSG